MFQPRAHDGFSTLSCKFAAAYARRARDGIPVAEAVRASHVGSTPRVGRRTRLLDGARDEAVVDEGAATTWFA